MMRRLRKSVWCPGRILIIRYTNIDEEGNWTDVIFEAVYMTGILPIKKYGNQSAKIAYISCLEEYIVIDELPSGHGYADITFIPRRASSNPVILIELKWNKTDKGAIEQIKRKDYPQALKDYGGDILLVGINYDVKSKKHSCKIEKYTVK